MLNVSSTSDFIVVGGGTNGLVAACYLLREGFSTIVLEANNEVGGGAITREITLPGFQHDVFATSINIWKASSIQQELELDKYGYREINPDPVAATPFKGGRAAIIYSDLNKTLESFSRFSKRDATVFKKFYDFYLENKPVLLGGMASPPPPYSELMRVLEESDTGLDFLQFSFMSSRDWLEENFESEEVKAFLALWGSNHVPLSPEDPGSALLSLVFAGLLQEKGVGIPIGGIKTLVSSLVNYITAHGGRIFTGQKVDEIIVVDGVAHGVRIHNGSTIYAKKGVIANVEPKTLFLKMVPSSALSEDFLRKVEAFRYSKVTQVMIHAALDSWLNYEPAEIRQAGMVQIGESLDEISKAYNECIRGEMPRTPFMTIDNVTCYDKTRAPAGKHILWDFARAPVYLKGEPWRNQDKEHFTDICVETLSTYANNIKDIILRVVVLSPQDIQSLNPNLVNGDPGGGKATIDQSLALRPFPGFSRYRTPIKALYMCSAATHPGGGVSGLPGHNAAMQAIVDAKTTRG
jgi:phytoene dehydrogenase-like protein